MRRLRMIATVLTMAAVAAGCGGGGDEGDDDIDAGAPTTRATTATTASVPTTAGGTTVPATNLTLRVADVRLVNSEESDNGVRILLPPGVATASVTLTGAVPSPNRVISVCQANDLDRRMSAAACRMPAAGEAVTVNLGSAASGVEVIQVGVSGSGAAANSTILDEVTIRYAAPSREVNVRLAQIASGESGGRPTFALTPAGTSGAYRANLTWTVIQVFGGTPSNALLELVQGGATGNKAEGGGLDVRLTGNLAPPGGEAAIRVSNTGSSAMVIPKLSLLLP